MKKQLRPLLALAVCLALIGTLAACGASGKSQTAASSEDMNYADEGMTMETTSAQVPQKADEDSGALVTGTSQIAVSNSAADYAKKIIYSASMQIETTDFDSAVSAVERLVSGYDGFVESSNIGGDPCYEDDGTTQIVNRYANYTLRIPADKLDSALSQAGSIGNVLSTHRDAQNITSQFTDNEARLDSLQVQEQRLLAMLKDATDVDTLVALEERLSDVRYEIENIQRTLKNWQMEVDYSTVDLSIREVEIYTPTTAVQRTFPQKIADAFSDGWSGFARGVQNFAVFIVGALPTLILLAVLASAVFLIFRKSRRRKNPPVSRHDSPDGGSDSEKQ